MAEVGGIGRAGEARAYGVEDTKRRSTPEAPAGSG